MGSANTDLVFFTIVAKNYVSYARVLCRSIRAQHPEAAIYVCLSDKRDEAFDIGLEGVSVVWADMLDLPNFDGFVFRYDVMEFSTAIKPYFFKWLYRNTSARKLIYLDPDIYVVSPLSQVIDHLGQGRSAVLTPHMTAEITDECRPSENDIMRVGVYNLGFIAVGRTDESEKLIDWWSRRLEKGAVVDLEKGLFTDQKWADMMPCLFDGVTILRDDGYNVAYWNLHSRTISNQNGEWFSNQAKLSFFHFSGVDPRSPGIFSKHQDRFMIADVGSLRPLYEAYLKALADNGFFESQGIPYGFGRFSDGIGIHKAARVYYRVCVEGAGEGVTVGGLTAEYFNQPCVCVPNHGIVTRFMYGLYLAQPELQKKFDLDTREGQVHFLLWFRDAAREIYKVPGAFVDAVSHLVDDPSVVATGRFSYVGLLKRSFYRVGYRIYVRYPEFSRALLSKAPASLRQKLRASAKSTLHTPPQSVRSLPLLRWIGSLSATYRHLLGFDRRQRMPGANVVGYLGGNFGVAQNVLSLANSLTAVHYPFDLTRIDAGSAYTRSPTAFDQQVVSINSRLVQIFCVNADQMPLVVDAVKSREGLSHYRIGYWFWELANFPNEWLGALDLVDELWAPSRFIETALRRVTTKKVTYMPVAVEFEVAPVADDSIRALPEDRFLFLFSYDFHSYAGRKNPGAVVAAFLRAFPEDDRVGLVVKTVHGAQHPEAYNELLALQARDMRVTVIDKVLPRDQMYALIDRCDAYVSLHRSEGFGLGLAEAMYLGKPVIGTAYSGNEDFMSAENSCLVDYRLIPVPEGAYPFAQDQVWADPDVTQAAEYMKRLVEDRDFRRSIAARAQETIRAQHAHQTVGTLMARRLNEISGDMKRS